MHISDDSSINDRTKMSRHKILLCEENGARRESLARLLKELDAEVMAVSSLSQALRFLIEKNGFHLFVTGLRAMGGPPLQILSSLKRIPLACRSSAWPKSRTPRPGSLS